MAIRGVLLDIDGTLVLSNDAHAHAWVHAFAEFGYLVPFERVRSLIGMGGDKLMPIVAPGLSSDEGLGKDISERRKAIFLEQYAPTLQPAPGARDLLEYMRSQGLRLVIASSAKRDELDVLLERGEIADLIDDATTTDDAEQSKPDPDIVQVALQKIGLPPTDVTLLGDTPYDIEAAGKAGLGTIAVRCGGFDDTQLKGASAIYSDPADLLAHYAASPLGAATQVDTGV